MNVISEQQIAKVIYDRIAGGEFVLQDAALETAGECAKAIMDLFESAAPKPITFADR